MLYLDVIEVVNPVVSVEEVGVLVAIQNDVVHNLLPALVNNVEYLFVKLYVNNTAYIVCSVYIPPGSLFLVNESFMSAAQYIIDAYPGSVFIISGDFNLPDLSWSNDDFGLIYSGPGVHCVPDVFAFNNFSNSISYLTLMVTSLT